MRIDQTGGLDGRVEGREVRKWGSPILPLPWGPGWNQTLSGWGGCMEGARSRVSLWHVELDPRGG